MSVTRLAWRSVGRPSSLLGCLCFLPTPLLQCPLETAELVLEIVALTAFRVPYFFSFVVFGALLFSHKMRLLHFAA